MIDISKLTDSDKGREVKYTAYEKTEYGRISSWSEKFIFVRYHTAVGSDGITRQRTGMTAEGTLPQDLDWL